MRALILGFVATVIASNAQAAPAELARQKARAAQVRIVRDDWGIAHVHGHTDAQAVFGMAYAQAEDDFDRVEANYIDALGRRAQADAGPGSGRDCGGGWSLDPASLRASTP